MATLTPNLLHKLDAYWRAANYLSVAQIYLYDNPLLKRPLALADVKHMLLGHWGTTPGQNFIYVHLNRIIKNADLDMIYISGPGHGGPAVVGSFPGGIPSHASPECPGSIHEGGELGYSLSHAFGAVFDNPELIVACVVGDGEAETGPLATAWHSNKFLDPATDGAVLPILHLNGYKIANPTVFARIEPEELEQFLHGCGWTPYFVEGDDPALMHEAMASTLDRVVEQIRDIQHKARVDADLGRPRWPMIVLKSPKGWAPAGERRMGANPHANGGILLRDLVMPEFRATPFDMTVLNDLDRFHLVMDATDRLPRTGDKGIYLKQQLKDKLIEHRQYIDKHGQEMPEIRDWTWSIPA
ncbi:hypothetical protein [Thiocapsa sp.]|uniref:phosphoketolase family protein n=1 Tax=Thiocapsa sp. TaxID=2024551 RepID=UPI0035943611